MSAIANALKGHVVIRRDDLAMLLARIDISVRDAERAIGHIDNGNSGAGRIAIANIPYLHDDSPFMRRVRALALPPEAPRAGEASHE